MVVAQPLAAVQVSPVAQRLAVVWPPPEAEALRLAVEAQKLEGGRRLAVVWELAVMVVAAVLERGASTQRP